MNDLRLLTKIATLYYSNDLTQEEIADRLGLSRQKIGRLLTQAKREGVVQISIHSPLLFSAELEYQLEQRFGLAEALVVEPRADTESAIKEAIGEAAGFLPLARTAISLIRERRLLERAGSNAPSARRHGRPDERRPRPQQIRPAEYIIHDHGFGEAQSGGAMLSIGPRSRTAC